EIPDEKIGKAEFSPQQLLTYQKQFAYNKEELESLLRVLGENGQEAVGSMGDDTPFAVLSTQPRVIYDYFRQYFAQVTNPPIDPLREAHVMSLNTSIGQEMSVFFETEGMSHRVNFKSPVLLYSDMQQLLGLSQEYYKHEILDATYDPKALGLKQAIEALADRAEQAARNGTVLLVLSDREISPSRVPIPAALSVGAVQQRLVEKNLRCDANIIVETGSARNPHHFAVLLGLGATAVYPYLAYESLSEMVAGGAITKPLR